MTPDNNPGSISKEKELLLKSAFLPAPGAVEAWQQFNASSNIEGLDDQSHRIFPQLYRNLRSLGVQAPGMKKLKGYYRFTLSKNLVKLQDASSILKGLHASGIKTMLIDGASLILQSRREHGILPMEELTILVPAGDAAAAIRQLQKLGCRSIVMVPGLFIKSYIRSFQGLPFRQPNGEMLLLYWDDSRHPQQSRINCEVWSNSQPAHFLEIDALIPGDEDRLLLACRPGFSFSYRSWYARITDALLIFYENRDRINWDRLSSGAKIHKLASPLVEVMEYIEKLFHWAVPVDTMRMLENLRYEEEQPGENDLKSRERSLFIRSLELWIAYKRYAGEKPHRVDPLGFARFLQAYWNLDGLWGVPIHAAQAALRALK